MREQPRRIGRQHQLVRLYAVGVPGRKSELLRQRHDRIRRFRPRRCDPLSMRLVQWGQARLAVRCFPVFPGAVQVHIAVRNLGACAAAPSLVPLTRYRVPHDSVVRAKPLIAQVVHRRRVAAVMAAVAWVHWWQYQRASRAAAQALAFNKVEIQLTQPAFGGVATQIDAQKYSLSEPRDIVKQPDSIKLDETISLTLRPLATSGGCAPSDIDKITVALDAPAFTISPVGDASRSRSVLLASSCDGFAAASPPAPAPWRWNLLATSAGNHLITLSMQALDKNGRAADSRIIDIPVTILAQPESLSTAIGVWAAWWPCSPG